MIWPFKRKPKHVGPTSVDWKPGDMAECIYWPSDKFLIGSRWMVASVGYGISQNDQVTAFWLRFLGDTPNVGRRADCFRKVVLTDTGADRKVGKRKPVGVDA